MNFHFFPGFGAEWQAILRTIRARGSAHDRHWRAHPAVATDDELTFGQRAADVMKGTFATWRALFLILIFMAVWIRTGGFGHDGFPFILLNLCLSCLAALQCFILLIAAKRADQIAAQIALHTLQNTEAIKQLIEQNTALTQALHDHILMTAPTQEMPANGDDDEDSSNSSQPDHVHPTRLPARQSVKRADLGRLS